MDEDGLWILLNILLVIVLVMMNGFFVASEFALVKVKRARLEEMSKEGSRRAKIAKQVAERLDKYLSASQFGITLSSIGLGLTCQPIVARFLLEPLFLAMGVTASWLSPLSFTVAFLLVAFLHFAFGEMAPRTLALHKSEGISLWLSGPLLVFSKVFAPFIYIFEGLASGMLRMFGVRPDQHQASGHTEEEIRILMKESQKSGHIDKDELALVENIFDFSERVAREIMIPRTMMQCLYAELSFEENLDIVRKECHTRYPIVEEDKDHVLGIVHATDMYNAALNGPVSLQQQHKFIRPITVVPESMEISEVLKSMQKDKVQMVVVIDEFGGTSGLITLEDIVEEIIGDVHDEIRPVRSEVEVAEETTSLDARILISKVNELFDVEIDDSEVDTLGGWIYSQLSDTPKVGQQVAYEHLLFEIKEVEHLGIQRIEVHSLPFRADNEMESTHEAVC